MLIAMPLCAQQPVYTDSVAVFGAVTNHHTGKPEPFCTVQLMREGHLVAGTLCDEEGFFTIDAMAPGVYTLKVMSGGLSLYQQQLPIEETVNLNISVITDSTTIRMLPDVSVVDAAIEHKLGELLISSPRDVRLWDFNYRPWVRGSRPVPHEARLDLSR